MVSVHIWEVTDLTPFNIDNILYDSKKVWSVCKVYGTQNDRLELSVTTHKFILNLMPDTDILNTC